MAKTRTRKKAEAPPAEEPKPVELEVTDPKRVHELFDLPGPYEPAKPPLKLPGYHTFWDPGLSIAELRRRQPTLLSNYEWAEKLPFYKASDQWRWKQFRVNPTEPGTTFADQEKKLSKGDYIPPAREVVLYLAFRFLLTGERVETPRLRCKEVLESGRRVVVGPFTAFGIELASVSDTWAGYALASVFTPKRK